MTLFGVNTLDSQHLGVFLAVWAVLWIAAAIFASALRRRLLQHEKPLDAPVHLDVYDLAYLADRSTRVRDAALVQMIAGGHLRLQWEHPRLQKAHKQKAAMDAPGQSEVRTGAAPPGVQAASTEVQAGVPVLPEPRGGETAAYSKIVKSIAGLQLQLLVDDPLPPGAHPVELKLYEALASRPAPWTQACHVAVRTLEDGIKDRLRRQGLLVNSAPFALLAPTLLLPALNVTWCILAIIYFALSGPPGNTDPTGKTQAGVIFSALCLVSCFFVTYFLVPLRHLNRRGEYVLAHASMRAPVPWPDQAPAQLALTVARSGIRNLPQVSPWTELISVLYPPDDSSSRGG